MKTTPFRGRVDEFGEPIEGEKMLDRPFKIRKIDAEAHAAKLARVVRASDVGRGSKSTTRIEELDDEGRTESERAALANFCEKASGNSKAAVAKRAKSGSHAQILAGRLAAQHAGHTASLALPVGRVLGQPLVCITTRVGPNGGGATTACYRANICNRGYSASRWASREPRLVPAIL